MRILRVCGKRCMLENCGSACAVVGLEAASLAPKSRRVPVRLESLGKKTSKKNPNRKCNDLFEDAK